MLPVFKLVLAHPEFAAVDFAQFYISAAEFKIAFLEAHGRGAIATTPALMEHEFTEAVFEVGYQRGRVGID